MHTEHANDDEADHGSMKSYITGFVLSIILTVIPFWMVMHPDVPRATILAAIVVLAVVQILVHLFYFLHMNGKSGHRWNMVSFAFTVLILALLVGGSVWIMNNMMDTLTPPQSIMSAP